MNILILSEMFPNPANPIAGIFVVEQMRALREQGVNCTVISPIPWVPPFLRSSPRMQKYLTAPERDQVRGFAVRYPRVPVVPGGRLLALSAFFYYRWCRRAVRELMQERRIDLIHAHAIVPIGMAAVMLGREFKVPVVCTVHGSDINVQPWRSRLSRWATNWALARVDGLFAVSSALKEKINSLSPAVRVNVLPNGADPDLFQALPKTEARSRLSLPQARKIVLFIGNLIPVKNVPVLLKAMAQLPSDTVLYLVGDGELREQFRQMASELGIEDRCTFVGRKPHTEIPIWLAAADCVVLPSQMEGLPTVLPESMLCRTPVIASAVGGIPEIVRHEKTGLLLAPGDVGGLRAAIARVLEEAEFARALADSAEQFARQELTWKANARKTLDVYEILQSRHGNRDEQPAYCETCGVQ